MPALRRLAPLLLAGWVGVGGIAIGTEPARAQGAAPGGAVVVQVETDLAGAKDLARQALSAGKPDLAVRIARQILATFPDDAEARLLLAAALTRAGAPAEAVPEAKAGFRLAERRPVRFEGAFLTAEALAAAGRPWAAKFWLRKADLYSPDAAHEALLARAYAGLSSQSRLTFGLSAYGGPSDNVNGGSLHDTFWFQGIPIPIDEALPGAVAGGSLSLGYALSPNTQARLTWSHSEVFLGDRARARDPTAREEDYRRDELSFGLSHVWRNGTGRLAVLGSASIGRRWTGGDHSLDLTRATLEVRRGMSEVWVLSGTLDVQGARSAFNPVSDSVSRRVGLQTSHLTPRLGAVTFALGAVDVASEAAGVAWRGPSLALGWRPAVRDGRVGFRFDLEAERRDFWKTPSFDPDVWVSLTMTADIPSLEIAGFEPTVTLQAARTYSDVVVRDTRELGISIGLNSSF